MAPWPPVQLRWTARLQPIHRKRERLIQLQGSSPRRVVPFASSGGHESSSEYPCERLPAALIELTKLSDEDMGGKNTTWQFDEKTQKLKFKKRYYNWSIARATLKERTDKFKKYFEKIIELQEAADEKLFCVILHEFKTHTFNSK